MVVAKLRCSLTLLYLCACMCMGQRITDLSVTSQVLPPLFPSIEHIISHTIHFPYSFPLHLSAAYHLPSNYPVS